MALNWIDTNDYSFNAFLLLERFQINLMLASGGWRNNQDAWRRSMGIALRANSAVHWYLAHRCPEGADALDALAMQAPDTNDAQQIRQAEVYALASVEDFIAYTTPEIMATQCDFIFGWNKQRLFDLVPLDGKTVLDVGAGTGRLAFAAAGKAAWAYASEPVGTLREFMRDKIRSEGIQNVRVLDGLVTALPFPDDTFDIVMSGHVVGDEPDAEIAELARVCKSGGWLVDCPGDSKEDMKSSPELLERSWEEFHYVGSFGADVFVHRKQVKK